MTGFKSGASPSGLDDDDDDTTDDAVDVEDTQQGAQTNAEQLGATESTTSSKSSSLPWIYQRSSITDGRAKTVQLHLQQTTLDEERDAKSDLERRLGETVNKADIREAAYLVGLSRLDAVANQLREWGYDAE